MLEQIQKSLFNLSSCQPKYIGLNPDRFSAGKKGIPFDHPKQFVLGIMGSHVDEGGTIVRRKIGSE